MRAHRRLAASLLALLLALTGPVALAGDDSATLEDVQKADALPDDQVIEALESLWDRMREDKDTPPKVRIALHEKLRKRWSAAGGFGEAISHAEALARLRGTPDDRITFAEVLLGAVMQRSQRGPAISANISPMLADLLAATEQLAKNPDALDGPVRARLVSVRAQGLYLRRDFDDALAWLEKVGIDSLPETHRSGTWDLAARCHYEQKRFAQAAQAWAKGGNGRAEAAAWAAAKDAPRTASSYAALLAENPADEQLALAARQAVGYAGATEDFLKQLEALPDAARSTPVMLAMRGRLLDASERTEEALTLWRALYEKAPNRPGLRAVLARALMAGPQGGESAVRDEALDLLEAALKADPEDALATALLQSIVVREYKALWRDGPERLGYRRCVRAQRALVAARPDDAVAWANLGNTLRVGGRAEEAHKAYIRAREENPYDPAIVSDAGLTLSALGRSQEALAAFEESVRLDGGHLAGRQNAARMLWRAGRDAEAAVQLAAGARTARARGQTGMTYRVLMDRTWRTRRNSRLR